jgi:predicted NUDIX family NTP pyrophosphohydrolase
MQKLSAGILAYKFNELKELHVLLVHPGGPFYKNKDNGAWSIPKGEYQQGEDALLAAKREFTEETGNVITGSKFVALEPIKIKSGKIIFVWAVQTDFESCFIKSNVFEMEWPPRSGKKQEFPEVDKAEWFTMEVAKLKINEGQKALLQQLEMLKASDTL